MDPHLLCHLLKNNVGQDAEPLIAQIGKQLLGNDEETAGKTLNEAKEKAAALLTILGKNKEKEQLRKEMKFTLEELTQSEYKITIEDCYALFDYAKLLYEVKDYKNAEKYLFNLKEILANESASHSALITKVFWGLLATQIINQKTREAIELTSLRKLKEMIKNKQPENTVHLLNQYQWIMHWILVASFTAQKSTGLFAALLADRQNFGDPFVNVMKLTNQNLMRYMVASFLLGRSEYQPQPDNQRTQQIAKLPRNALPQLALPIILAERDSYQDSFTLFTEALFEEFDFEKAIELAEELTKEAENDVFLKPHAAELRRQALLYVFETETKLYKTGIDLTTFCDQHKISEVDVACREVQASLASEELRVHLSDGDMIGSQ